MAEAAQASRRRLVPIVDRRFQLKYTVIVVVLSALVSSVLGFFLLRAYFEMNDILEVAQLSPDLARRLDADDMRGVFHGALAFLVVEVVLLGVFGLVVTHKVAGPIFVIHRHLQTIVAGIYPAARALRTGDEFRDVFATLSVLVEKLKERDLDDLTRLRRVFDAAERARLPADELDTLRRLMDERTQRLAAADTAAPRPTS